MIVIMYFIFFHLNTNYNVIVTLDYPLHDLTNKIIFEICF